MKRAILRGVVDGWSSYSFHLLRIIEGLSKLGYDVNTVPITFAKKGPISRVAFESLVHKQQFDEWEMIVHCPSFSPQGGKKIAFNTMWETSRLNRNALLNLNQAEVVIVPSVFNQCSFNAQGVNRPIFKVPLGIDTGFFHYRQPERKDVYSFGVAGRTEAGGCRKGFEDVVAAFAKAFPKRVKDVELVVKCYPEDPDISFDDPRIRVVKQFWDRKSLSEWYAGLDCFVSASKGEGWGLMQHEAMATGRSVIAVPFGGITEFFDDSVGYPVEFDLEPSKGHYENGGMWAVPRMDSLVDRMREVHSRRGNDKELRASQRGMSLDWDNSNKKLAATMRSIGAWK